MKTLSENKFHKVALALGSNVGNAENTFDAAVKLLRKNAFEITAQATVLQTAPVDCPPGTPDFANSALTGLFAGTPEELLQITQKIEQTLGRPADHGFHTPRTLDIDIIIFGNTIMNTPQLTIPHPAAQKRAFVLIPLAEIAPEWQFSDSGISVSKALKLLTDQISPATQIR